MAMIITTDGNMRSVDIFGGENIKDSPDTRAFLSDLVLIQKDKHTVEYHFLAKAQVVLGPHPDEIALICPSLATDPESVSTGVPITKTLFQEEYGKYEWLGTSIGGSSYCDYDVTVIDQFGA